MNAARATEAEKPTKPTKTKITKDVTMNVCLLRRRKNETKMEMNCTKTVTFDPETATRCMRPEARNTSRSVFGRPRSP